MNWIDCWISSQRTNALRIHVAVVRGHRRKVNESVDPGGKVVPDVAKDAAGPRGWPDQSDLLRCFARDRAGILESLDHRRRVPEQLDGFRELFARAEQSRPQVVDLPRLEVEPDAARPDETAAESRAAELRRHVEEVAAQPAAERSGRQIRDVSGKSAEVAGVVRQPFELQRDPPKRLRARRHSRSAERLDRMGVGQGVADRRVAGGGLHVVDRPLRRPSDERALDAAVLVTERDLEMEDVLAVALKAEMARLDDARVHGPDRDLVDLGSGNGEEVHDAGRDRLGGAPAPGVAPGVDTNDGTGRA